MCCLAEDCPDNEVYPMHITMLLLTLASIVFCKASAQPPRLAILTDIAGDLDDQQSMVWLMVYANEFELELLLASTAGTPGELKEAATKPELIHEIIAGYEKALPNLKKHACGWPEAERLRQCVKSGNPQRGRDHIGEEHDTESSRELISLIDAGSTKRPLNIAIWGGQTVFAQALTR